MLKQKQLSVLPQLIDASISTAFGAQYYKMKQSFVSIAKKYHALITMAFISTYNKGLRSQRSQPFMLFAPAFPFTNMGHYQAVEKAVFPRPG